MFVVSFLAMCIKFSQWARKCDKRLWIFCGTTEQKSYRSKDRRPKKRKWYNFNYAVQNWVSCDLLSCAKSSWTDPRLLLIGQGYKGRRSNEGWRMRSVGEGESTFNASAQAEPTRLRKLIFGKDTKHVILQTVRHHNANQAIYNKIDESFEKLKEKLFQNVLESVWRCYHKATTKMVHDKLCSMITER